MTKQFLPIGSGGLLSGALGQRKIDMWEIKTPSKNRVENLNWQLLIWNIVCFLLGLLLNDLRPHCILHILCLCFCNFHILSLDVIMPLTFLSISLISASVVSNLLWNAFIDFLISVYCLLHFYKFYLVVFPIGYIIYTVFYFLQIC